MTEVNSFSLEHFYYGQIVKDGRPEGEMQLLAASAGVKPDAIVEAIAVGLIPPMVDSATGSWALVRGRRNVPFVLVQSQLGAAHQTMLHFIIFSAESLRAQHGNLKTLSQLIQMEMPTYEQAGRLVAAINLPETQPPSMDAQIDEILELMTYTFNRIDTIEALLAAIVQGVPLIVQNAPPELGARVTFLQGLLALLPPSARFGVTFATHTIPSSQTDAQIRFHIGGKLSRETLVYDWPSGKLAGKAIDDPYSRFIVSQLRLDPELVSTQTRRLTAVAAWRIRRGDGLAESLAYGARRLKLDDALENNQPVETADVSRILAEDPTLTEDQKLMYTRHLLAFGLALGDMQHADPVAVMVRQQPELERGLQVQLNEALENGKAGVVYDAVSRWLGNPLGPIGREWVELGHRAGLAHMDALVAERNVPAITQFLESVHTTSPGVEVGRIVPKLVEMALPLTTQDRDLNHTVFLLAVNHLESEVLRRLLAAQRFAALLPEPVSKLATLLVRPELAVPQTGLLVEAARAFDSAWQDLILIRLTELALIAKRTDIVDTETLGALVKLLPSQWAAQYSGTLTWIAKMLSNDDVLRELDVPGPLYLLQILLATGAYKDLGAEVQHQARTLYPGDGQTEYPAMLQQLFAETQIQPEQALRGLQQLNESSVRGLPLIMAHIGFLEGHEKSEGVEAVAQYASRLMFETPALSQVITSLAVMALLRFHVRRQDAENTIRVSALLPDAAARESVTGMTAIGRAYKLLDWDETVQIARVELMRRYIRVAPEEDIRKAIPAFGREFGMKLQQTLEASYAIRRMMSNVGLNAYADFLHVTANFLFDTALAYQDKSHPPSFGLVMNDLDSLAGGLNDEERRMIVQEMQVIGKAITALGDQARSNRPRDLDRHIESLITGKVDPVCALDVLLILGGYLTKGKRYVLKLEGALKHPLGDRTTPSLRDDLQITSGLLRSALRAFAPDRKLTLTAQALRGEMDSLWGEVPSERQRDIVRDLAIDLQRTSALLSQIVADSSERIFDDNSSTGRKLERNEQPPRNTLELYRFIGGYFRSRVRG